MFNRSRLVLARKRRGFSKIRLAELLGVEPRTLKHYEAGSREPPEPAVARLAEVLGVPVAFFGGPDVEELREETASFRALSKMSSSQRNRALASGTLATELAAWVAERFNLPSPDLPELDGLEPEAAAEALRARWHLGEGPIGNLIHLLEAHGVWVFSLGSEVAREVDAFSLWKAATPYMFLNTLKTGERSRFDAAHELAHLVLHRHGSPGGRLAETEANRFASAFLMPRQSILARRPWPPTLDALIEQKKYWSVSLMAYAYRCHQVGVLSDWHYHDVCVRLAPRRAEEPDPIRRETSQLLSKVFAALREDGVHRADLACDLRLTVADLEELVFGLVLTSVQGGGRGPSSPGRAALRAVT